MRTITDWNKCRKGWNYKKDAPEDLKWLKDRDNLFKENGNGWWAIKGTAGYKDYLRTTKERLDGESKNSRK